MKHRIKFFVKGDWVVDDFILEVEEIECDTIEELVELTYPQFKLSMGFITRKLESDVRFEPRPNQMFSIETDIATEEEVLSAFYRKRIDELHQSINHYLDNSNEHNDDYIFNPRLVGSAAEFETLKGEEKDD